MKSSLEKKVLNEPIPRLSFYNDSKRKESEYFRKTSEKHSYRLSSSIFKTHFDFRIFRRNSIIDFSKLIGTIDELYFLDFSSGLILAFRVVCK